MTQRRNSKDFGTCWPQRQCADTIAQREKSRKCFAVDCVHKPQKIFQRDDRMQKQRASTAKIIS
jgi:hypothetical protein